MYYSIFEAIPYEGKEVIGGQYYQSLLPHLHTVSGFHGDDFCASPNTPRKAVNVATWNDVEAINLWRNEEHHLRLQGKGRDVYESYRIRIGQDASTGGDSHQSEARHFVTILSAKFEQEPVPDDPTQLLATPDTTRLKDELMDSAAYVGSETIWITSWRSSDAMSEFGESIMSIFNGKLIKMQVSRDYSKSDRRDAPHSPGSLV